MGTQKYSWRFIPWEKVHITLYITRNAAVEMFEKAVQNVPLSIVIASKMQSTAVGKLAGIKGPN